MLEKTPLKSKKFIAFFFAMSIISSILAIALFTQKFSWSIGLFMCIGMMAISFISIGYILSQNALDKFVRGIGQIKGFAENGTDSENPLE